MPKGLAGLSSPIFRNLFEVEEDNGEKFLVDYFTEQQARKFWGKTTRPSFASVQLCIKNSHRPVKGARKNAQRHSTTFLVTVYFVHNTQNPDN
jgi:hypothetical protein